MISMLTNPDNILAAFVAVVCFATIVTIATPMFNHSNLESRLKSVSTRREELRRKSREALAKKGGQNSLRHLDEGMYKKVVDRLQPGSLRGKGGVLTGLGIDARNLVQPEPQQIRLAGALSGVTDQVVTFDAQLLAGAVSRSIARQYRGKLRPAAAVEHLTLSLRIAQS